VCLILRRRFEPGAGLAIEVVGPNDAVPSILLARVVHVRAEAGGQWALGCTFVSPLSEEEVQALTGTARLDSLETGAETPSVEQRRQAPPRGAHVVGIDFRGKLPGGGTVECEIRNLDTQGHWPLPPGRTLGMRFHGMAVGDPVVTVRVDACRPVGDRWALECTFVGEVPAALLASAGPAVGS
jgi:hypothetical protein